jgi:NADPH:quinone reductase-like Zn-dependent oxidoreductase
MLNKRVIVTRYGGPESIEIIEEPLQPTSMDEVLIKVESAGVALGDIMRREGLYPASPTPPFTPGYDVVGIIEETGQSVQNFKKGEKVAAFFNGTGGYSSYVYAKPEQLVKVPAHLDSSMAVAVVLNYVTAYQMLHRVAKVIEGESILIHGASGGVGTALLQLGKLANLRMYGTASLEKHRVITEYGAKAIDYKSEDFVEVLRNLVPGGMDAVFDPIGGKNWDRSIQTLGNTGRFIGYGYTKVLDQENTGDWITDWSALAKKQTSASGNPIHLYSITKLRSEKHEWFQQDVQFLFSLLEKGDINPLIAARVPLEEAATAQKLLQESKTVGKIVLTS